MPRAAVRPGAGRRAGTIAAGVWAAAALVAGVATIPTNPLAHDRHTLDDAAGQASARPTLASRESTTLTRNQDGLDVLYGDGVAPPYPNPFMGPQVDNIYTGPHAGRAAAATSFRSAFPWPP